MINAYISVENGILSKTNHASVGWKNGNVLFNDTLNTFYVRLYGVGYMVKDHLNRKREETCSHHYMGYSFWLTASDVLYAPSQEGRKEMFYLTTHSTHFIYGYMASDIW